MIQNIISNRQIIWALAKRDIKSRYAGSAAGFVWAFVQPAMMIAVFTVIFGTLMGSSLGAGNSMKDFAFYLCVGLLPWNALHEIVSRSSSSYIEHAGLIRKLPLKLEVFPAQSIVAAFITLGVNLTVLMAAMIAFGYYPGVNLAILPFAVLLELVLVVGMSFGLAAITVFYRDMAHFVSVGLFLWFWLTPIVYRPEIMPPWAIKLIWFNPFTHVADVFRFAFLGGQAAAFPIGGSGGFNGIVYTLGVSGVLLTIGTYSFDKLHRKIPEQV